MYIYVCVLFPHCPMYVFMRASTIHTRVLKAHHSKRRTRRTKARRAINIYRASISLYIYNI